MLRFSPNDIDFVPKEVPIINFFCLFSLENWTNLRKLAIN